MMRITAFPGFISVRSWKFIFVVCRGSAGSFAPSITFLGFVGHRSRGPGRPIGHPGLGHELLKVLGRVHVHLAPHEVDREVRGDAAAHEVEAADAGTAVWAGEFALGPTAL